MALARAYAAHEQKPCPCLAMVGEIAREVPRDGQNTELFFPVLPEGVKILEGLVDKPFPEHAVGEQGVQSLLGGVSGPLLHFAEEPLALAGLAGKLRPVGLFPGDLQVGGMIHEDGTEWQSAIRASLFRLRR